LLRRAGKRKGAGFPCPSEFRTRENRGGLIPSFGNLMFGVIRNKSPKVGIFENEAQWFHTFGDIDRLVFGGGRSDQIASPVSIASIPNKGNNGNIKSLRQTLQQQTIHPIISA
jgi:hypothetical protein